MGLNSEDSTGKWELVAKEGRGMTVDGKLLRRNIRDTLDGLTKLT